MGLQDLHQSIRNTFSRLGDDPSLCAQVDAVQKLMSAELLKQVRKYGNCTAAQADELYESFKYLAEFWVQSALGSGLSDEMFDRLNRIYANVSISIFLGALVTLNKFCLKNDFKMRLENDFAVHSGGRVGIVLEGHLLELYVQQLMVEIDKKIIDMYVYGADGSRCLSQILNASFSGDSATLVDYGAPGQGYGFVKQSLLKQRLTFAFNSFKDLYRQLCTC